MDRAEISPECTPGAALRRWMELAKNHDVYMELDFGFAGVMGDPDRLPPRLARRLDEWMRAVIHRCRSRDKEERWLRLRLSQRGRILRMECEAAGRPPEYGELQEAGAYLEVEEMGESFWLALEAGLTVYPQGGEAPYRTEVISHYDYKEDAV